MPYFVCEKCKAGHCARKSPGPNIVVDHMCDFFIGWCDIEKYKPPECTEIVVKDSKGKMHLAFISPVGMLATLTKILWLWTAIREKRSRIRKNGSKECSSRRNKDERSKDFQIFRVRGRFD